MNNSYVRINKKLIFKFSMMNIDLSIKLQKKCKINELLYNFNGTYQLKTSNFHDGIDSTPVNQIFFKIWDANISNYAYYGSIENQGGIKITRFNGTITTNWILSGTFQGKFVRYDNPNAFITITDGRFDLNLNTLPNTTFP